MISEHETLLTLEEAAADFGGVKVPVVTVQRWVYQGIKGLKLESVLINKGLRINNIYRFLLDFSRGHVMMWHEQGRNHS